jgi:hypothetical protein
MQLDTRLGQLMQLGMRLGQLMQLGMRLGILLGMILDKQLGIQQLEHRMFLMD